MTELNPEKVFCSAKKKDGGECHGWPDKSGKCPAHREGFHQIAVYGGQCKSRQHQLETRLPVRLRLVLDLLANGIKETHEGTLQPARAQAMASLAGALIKATGFTELEARLSILEKKLNGGEK